MAVCYLIADALLVQFVEEGIEVVVFRKQLHEADAERVAGSADLYQNGMQRGGFGLDLAKVPLGSSHRCPPYIVQRDGGVLTKCLMGLCQQLVTHRQGWYLLKSCHTVVHAVVISQQVVGIVLQGYPLAAIADLLWLRSGGYASQAQVDRGSFAAYLCSKGHCSGKGQKVEYSKHKGLADKKCEALLLDSLNDHKILSKQEIVRLLWDVLPDQLDDKQKNTKVYNILRKLRESGKIVNQTTGNKSAWSLAKT